MSDSNKLVLTAIIGIFVGLVLGRLLWYSKTSLPDELPVGEEATTTESVPSEPVSEVPTLPSTQGNSISAIANQPAGNIAQAKVQTDRAVWVEVRDNNNGVMGKVLGAKHFSAGTMTVTVPLLRTTEAGKSYFVALVPYTGETLDYSAKAVMMQGSVPVADTFTAQ